MLEPGGLDDEVAFARALQEIARAVGESIEVEQVCAAAVVAMVRCAQVSRAEVYLVEGQALRRVASSDLAGLTPPEVESDAVLKHALATFHPQIGISRAGPGSPGSIFAALPLTAQRRGVGLLVLHKEQGAAFSVREMDLWSAAAGQLAVAVENARLLREAKAALQIREEFMSIASHELKTPLTPLKMGLYTMEKRLAQGLPVELSSIFKSKRQVDRLAGLVDDLLDASRLELGKLALTQSPLDSRPAPLRRGRPVQGLVLRAHVRARAPEDPGLGERRPRPARAGAREPARERAQVLAAGRADRARAAALARAGDLLACATTGSASPPPTRGRCSSASTGRATPRTATSAASGSGSSSATRSSSSTAGSSRSRAARGRGRRFTVTVPRVQTRELRKLPRRVLVFEESHEQELQLEQALRAEGYEVLSARDTSEALRKLSQLPVDVAVLASERVRAQGDLFLETLRKLPAAHAVPLLFTGASLPVWASPSAPLCPKPCDPERIAQQVRSILGAGSQLAPLSRRAGGPEPTSANL